MDESKQIRFFVGSWNCGAETKDPSLIDLKAWLNPLKNRSDAPKIKIFFITLQEVLTCQAKEEVPVKDKSIFFQWNAAFLKFFNTLSKVELHYTTNLGGNLTSIFVSEDIKSRITETDSFDLELSRSRTTIKCGLCYRFKLDSKTISFSGVHFSADQEGDNTEQRIIDTNAVTSFQFPQSKHFFSDHNISFIAGDFNFRVNLERAEIVELSKSKKIRGNTRT